MKEPDLKEWASRLLEDQLMRLAELRNASPRDAGFKLWRQTTLTVIQRVWPGNLQRSERFRRVPFTPSTARPTRVQAREHFERGCAEATGYLRELIQEIQNGAVEPSRAAEAPTPPPSPASISASLAAPLPGEVERPAERDEEPIVPPSRLATPPPPILGFQSSSLSADPGSAPAPAAPAPAAPAPAASRPAAGRAGRPPRKNGRALKEMLGFVDEPAAGGAAPLAEGSLEQERPGASFGQPPPPPPPAASLAPEVAPPLPLGRSTEPPLTEDEPLPFGGSTEPPPIEDESLPLVDESAMRPLPAPAATPLPAEQVERLDEVDEPALAQSSVEPLPASWSAVQSETAPVKAAPRSPVATALHALAGEVAELGVPEGKRAAARAALTDLARQIEDRTADWETLRDAFSLAMDYPPLARRVVPLLVPFLDLE